LGSGEALDKGLKKGALGLVSAVVIGVASTAPAYSLAATLGGVVVAVGLQSPIVAIIAFVPMLFVAVGYNELNREEPDCGTTFTWAAKAFGPKTGWLGGWGIVAADVLVMASLAQVAGQYFFLLIGVDSIGTNATSPWVLLVGVVWIVVMTWICYIGIEVSANVQKALLSIELVMLSAFSIVALTKVYSGNGIAGSHTPQLSWFNPGHLTWTSFTAGALLMLFIYWGWDTAVAVNEETADRTRTPGRAAVISTVLLLLTYALVTTAALSFAGVGTTGTGLANPANASDVLSVLGKAAFGSGTGTVFARLLILMVLSSAAASTQTTILPTARTTLSMAAYRSIPRAFARIHPRHLTPSVSTVAMGAVSIVLYVALNFVSGGNVIVDSVSALGWMIAFYYGLTGFACAWYFRKVLRRSARDFWMRGVIPFLGGAILFTALVKSIHDDWAPASSYTSWQLTFPPHWHIGGIFVIGVGTSVLGVVLLLISIPVFRPYFSGKVIQPAPELAELLHEGPGPEPVTPDEIVGLSEPLVRPKPEEPEPRP
jgi:amino acid transporter